MAAFKIVVFCLLIWVPSLESLCSEDIGDEAVQDIASGKKEGLEKLALVRKKSASQLMTIAKESSAHSTRLLAVRSLGELRCDDCVLQLIEMLRRLPKFPTVGAPRIDDMGNGEEFCLAVEAALISVGDRKCREEVLNALCFYEEAVPAEFVNGVRTVKVSSSFEAKTEFRKRLIRILVGIEGANVAGFLVRDRADLEKALGDKANGIVLGNLKEAEKELIALSISGERPAK